MLDRAIINRRIMSLGRQENALIEALSDWAPGPTRDRIALRLREVQAAYTALRWANGDNTWPQSQSEAETKRFIRKEYDNA